MTEFGVGKQVDELLGNRPEILKKVKDNREFITKIKDKKIKKEQANVEVFGVKNVNVNAILKDNIWSRDIFTTDKLCRMFLSCTLEQLKKYERKKRVMPLNLIWILFLIMGVVAVIFVIIMLLPKFGIGI